MQAEKKKTAGKRKREKESARKDTKRKSTAGKPTKVRSRTFQDSIKHCAADETSSACTTAAH